MTGPRPENDLELAIRRTRSGELAMEQLAPALGFVDGRHTSHGR